MKKINFQDLRVEDYFTFLKPPKAKQMYFNQGMGTMEVNEFENHGVIGRLYQVLAIDLPFIVICDIGTQNCFTMDTRNGGEIRMPSEAFAAKFVETFKPQSNVAFSIVQFPPPGDNNNVGIS